MFPWTIFWAPQYNVTWNSHFFQDVSGQSLINFLQDEDVQDLAMTLRRGETPRPQQLEAVKAKFHKLTEVPVIGR